MPLFTVHEVIAVTGAKVVRPVQGSLPIARLCADSRQVRRGDLFVAFRGEQVDGHQFLAAAQAKGAVGALIEDASRLPAGAVRSAGWSSRTSCRRISSWPPPTGTAFAFRWWR